MKTSPVNSFLLASRLEPIAAQFKGCTPKDILTQGKSSSSSDGFLMCMLKPIGRFFQSIFSFFKYLLCCCSSSYQLPKLTPQLLKILLSDADDSNYVQKSDYCIEIYENGKAIASFKIMPFGKSIGMQVNPLAEPVYFDGVLDTDMFVGSSAYLIKEIPDDKIEMAQANGFIKEEDFWVRKGPVEGVLSTIVMDDYTYSVSFLKEDNTFETVNIHRNALSNNFDVSGLEMCPGRVKDLVTWARSVMDNKFTLVVTPDSDAINGELKEAGFVTTNDKTFTLELKTDE